MTWVSSELVAALVFLLPGFVSAATFYTFTSHSRPRDFMIVVQALMFTMIVQGIGLAAQIDDWAKPFELLLVVGIALIVGIVAAWMSNYDLPHRLL